MILGTIIVLSVFLIGYSIGRRIGICQGKNEGLVFYLIKLKQEMLETSLCPLCHHKLNQDINCDNIHNRD